MNHRMMLAGDAPPGATEGVKLSGACGRVFTFMGRTVSGRDFGEAAPPHGIAVPKVKAQGRESLRQKDKV